MPDIQTSISMGTIKVISETAEPFDARIQAGQLLAEQLAYYKDKQAVVLGIPRGGIIIADQIAKFLNADMDVVLTHKLGAPYNPELAIGAVCEDGTAFINTEIAATTGADKDYIKKEKALQVESIRSRVHEYRKYHQKLPLTGRIVIITDDGVATGATMQAALWAAKQESPQRLIAALPLGPLDTLEKLSNDCDELVCLRAPQVFMALGRFYMNFSQVTDEEVVDILRNAN